MMIALARTFFALLLMSAVSLGYAQGGPNIITADQAHEMQKAGKVILIDIRTPDEWRKTGIPAGARLADASQAEGPAGFLQDVLDIVGDQRTQPIAIICRTGNRTTRAQAFLMSKGFTEVYNVKEGVAGSDAGIGWFKRELPLESCDC